VHNVVSSESEDALDEDASGLSESELAEGVADGWRSCGRTYG
jgi:hypothetical protein